MDFKNLKKSVLSLFEKHGKYHYNYTHLIAPKLGDTNVAATEIHEWGLDRCAGDSSEFYIWISFELESFFSEFATLIRRNENETVNRLREKMHQYIEKDCKYKKFKQDLAYYIYVELKKFKWVAEFNFGGGRNIILKIIIDYIYDLYCLEKKE